MNTPVSGRGAIASYSGVGSSGEGIEVVGVTIDNNIVIEVNRQNMQKLSKIKYKSGEGKNLNGKGKHMTGKSNRAGVRLNCFYMNARSLINKRDELELYVKSENPDIIGVTETWALDSIEDSELSLEGYTMLRKDRIIGEKLCGGGILLYFINSVSVEVREDLEDKQLPESLWCNIEIGGEKTLVGVCYRPDGGNKLLDEALYNTLTKASAEKLLIMGDFNFPELHWDKPETLEAAHPFMKCINDNFLIQVVDEPTRGKNVLDLVFTTEENMIENLTVGEPFGTSDHLIVRWTFVACKEIVKIGRENKTKDFFNADYDQMRNYAKTIEWSKIVQGVDINADFECFKSTLDDMKEKWVPFKKRKRGKCKWVTRAVIKCRRAKIKAWNKYGDQKSQENYEIYKGKLNQCTKTIRSAKRNYEKKLAENVKQDCKSFYSYVRSKQRTRDKVGPLKNNLGKIVTDKEEAANLLNDYFSSVFTIEDCTKIPDPNLIFKGNSDSEGLNNMLITVQLVEKKLETIKVNKCPGLDGIHPKMIWELRKELALPLAILYNCSLSTGTVPNGWREAGVTPLFKKGKKSETQNYRPVSMTSIICKIMESLLKDVIVEHLSKFSLIKDSQHGFTKGRSCLTNLLEFMEDVTLNIDQGKPVDIVYLDFAKAFDKVPYKRLFRKLGAHGIGGNILQWIESWLSGRRQKVGVDGAYSNWRDVVSGVPQGSVLGPVLFIIFINDLDSDVISKLGKFADDTKLGRGISDQDDIEIMRNDLDKIFQWSVDWQMSFNTDKCTVIHMGKNNNEAEYKMGDKILKKSTVERDLGVLIDCSGKASEQCALAAKKANAVLGMIKRNISFKSKDNIVRLYKSLVRPRLEYCVQAWCPYVRKDVEMLEKVQRRATKMIEGYGNLKYEDRLMKTGLISLEKRRARGDLIQVFKIIKGIDKLDYRNFFEISKIGKTRGHSYKLTKKRAKGNLRKNFFSQRVVNSWNKLPQEVVDADTINCFKNRLDKFDKYWESWE